MTGRPGVLPSDDAVLALLARTPGPAPWYWHLFPEFDSGAQPLAWSLDEASPYADHALRLRPRNEREGGALSVAMYTTAFALPPNLLGLHFLDGSQIHVFAIDPDQLHCLQYSKFVKSADNYRGFAAVGGVLARFTIDLNLEAGDHPIDLPLAFAGLDSLLIPGPYSKAHEAACAAIFEVCDGSAPGSRRVRVLPQKWFDRDTYDLGYVWITRVAREPISGRIVGDGIRLPGTFILAEDGCRLDCWLETRGEPRHGRA